MIVAISLLIGLVLRLLTGKSIGSLSMSKLKGETLLLILLLVQTTLPALRFTGTGARIAFYLWLATFPFTVGIAWTNRREAGMAALGLGLALNFAVISVNGGMPVFGAAVAAASSPPKAFVIPATDFVHVVGGIGTRLPWLADVIPLSGPAWLRLVASPGDLLLYGGIVAFLAATHGSSSGLDARISRKMRANRE